MKKDTGQRWKYSEEELEFLKYGAQQPEEPDEKTKEKQVNAAFRKMDTDEKESEIMRLLKSKSLSIHE